MSILKDIPELITAEVITQETAERIRNYYKNKGSQATNRLFVVFGILGAILVGLGIILIIAHNWAELSRATKTCFAFLPLVVGQILCGYIIIKKQGNTAWTESGAAFLFFAVGASISLVSQIYNIPGDLGSFLLTWSLLCLPLIYVMNSSVASLLFIIGITYYAKHTSYWSYPYRESYPYWLLLLSVIPHYYRLYKKNPTGNFMVFHHWAIPLSVIATLGTLSNGNSEFIFIAYVSLFGLFYLIGSNDFFTKQKTRNNSYQLLGSLGTIVVLLVLSFDWFWAGLRTGDSYFNELTKAPEFFAATILSLLAGGLFYWQYRGKPLSSIKPVAPIFILFIATFVVGIFTPFAVVLINLYILAIGILTIRDGAKRDRLDILNYGLLIITALVICRFFDTDLSFVLRGLLFISVGAGFFIANYRILKKRKTNEQD